MLVTTGGKTVLKFLNNSTVKKPKEKTYLRLDKLTSVMFIGAKNKTSFKFLN